MDWNEVLDAGDVDGGEINVVVEIPKGSSNKVEWKRNLKVMAIDRVESNLFPKPTNYGFIPQTLDVDGDELDALVITDRPLPTNVFVKSRVLGVLKFVDDGDVDDKIITVPVDDREAGNTVKSLEDLPKSLLTKIEYHFSHYKDLKKPGTTKVLGIEGATEAKKVIKEAQKRWTER